MDHPPVDADYFAQINRMTRSDAVPVKQIYRKIGDGPIVGYHHGSNGEIYVQEDLDIPYIEMVQERMPSLQVSADQHGWGSFRLTETICDERLLLEWLRDVPVQEPDEPRTKPFEDRKVETSFLLAAPVSYDGMSIVTSVYIPHDYGKQPMHLFVYYSGPSIHWSPTAIGGDEKLFGVGYVQYDDDAERTEYTIMRKRLTYAAALALFHATLENALAL